jgi:hypothetical protein
LIENTFRGVAHGLPLSSPTNGQVLFDLLRCGAATLVEHVWSVLQLVPSSRSMLTQCCHPAALAWADVLPSRLPYFEQQADAAASLTVR